MERSVFVWKNDLLSYWSEKTMTFWILYSGCLIFYPIARLYEENKRFFGSALFLMIYEKFNFESMKVFL